MTNLPAKFREQFLPHPFEPLPRMRINAYGFPYYKPSEHTCARCGGSRNNPGLHSEDGID